MERKLVAVYGSLKIGFYNHDGLGDNKKYLGNIIVNGVMYSNGSYPKLYKDDKQGSGTKFDSCLARDHAVEVYEIDESNYRTVNSMEIGAGYRPEPVQTPWGWATIYYVPHGHFSPLDHWVEAYSKSSLSHLY